LDREFATAEEMLNRMFRTVIEGDIQPLKVIFRVIMDIKLL
jgi:hypothetical protein